jgi:hypothetical protein
VTLTGGAFDTNAFNQTRNGVINQTFSAANGIGTLEVLSVGVPEASTLLLGALLKGTGGLLLWQQRRLQSVAPSPAV